jgi:hypothetical protein
MTAGPNQFRKTLHRTDSSRIEWAPLERILNSLRFPFRLSRRVTFRRRIPQSFSSHDGDQNGNLQSPYLVSRKELMESCGVGKLQAFINYVSHGDGAPWDNTNPGLIRNISQKPIRPATVKAYHAYLASFFNWLVSEGILPAFPMLRVMGAIDSEKDKVIPRSPFSPRHVECLLYGCYVRSLARVTWPSSYIYSIRRFAHRSLFRSKWRM